MLALLEHVPGVGETRVDWTGRRFLMKLEPGARPEEVVRSADETLGGGSRRADVEDEIRAVQSYRHGETWMRSGETLQLSREEARVMAERHGREAAEKAGLDAERTQRFVKLIEEEFAAAFERIHASSEGLGARMAPEFTKVVENTLSRSRSFVSEAEAARLKAYLASLTR